MGLRWRERDIEGRERRSRRYAYFAVLGENIVICQ